MQTTHFIAKPLFGSLVFIERQKTVLKTMIFCQTFYIMNNRIRQRDFVYVFWRFVTLRNNFISSFILICVYLTFEIHSAHFLQFYNET